MRFHLILLIFGVFEVVVAAINEEVLVQMLNQLRQECLPQFPDLPVEFLNKVQAGYEPDDPPTSLKVLRCKVPYSCQIFYSISVLYEMLLRLYRRTNKKRRD